MAQATIRLATEQDLPAIHQLVKELAVYERAENEVTATLEDYYRDFAAGIFEALVVESGGEIVGMALYFLVYSTWKGRMLFLEDFIVKESLRGQGVGQQLFDAIIGEARKKDVVLMKWQVLDWNEPAIRFYRKNNAFFEKEWYNGKLFLKQPGTGVPE